MSRLSLCRPLAIVAITLSTLGVFIVDRLHAQAWSGPRRADNSLDSSHWREAQSCGVACGYMLARLLGQNVDYKDAVRAIPIEDGGTSLLALQEGLQELGVSTTVLKAQPKELDRLAMPVIAHMLPRHETSNSIGHFLLVLKIDERFVRYVEPNFAASIETVPRSQFLRCWSGYLVAPGARKTVSERCLELVLWGFFATSISIGGFPAARSLFGCIRTRWKRRHVFFVSIAWACLMPGCAASRPSFHASGRRPGPPDLSRLVAWNTETDLGTLPPNGGAEALFRIENQGDAVVRLHLGSPTCRCSQARLETDDLKPGEATNVHMMIQSRPHQAGPADARVYVEAEGGRWAEMLSVHAVQLGANFPEYTYVIGGPPPASRTASVVGDLFLKSSAANANVNVSLVGTGLESALVIRDLQVGPSIEMAGCVRRVCSFTVDLNSKASPVNERREVLIPVSVSIDGETSTRRVRLTVLPSGRSKAGQAG